MHLSIFITSSDITPQNQKKAIIEGNRFFASFVRKTQQTLALLKAWDHTKTLG
jgi:hypothetical protein